MLERAVLVCKSTILEVDAEQLNEALAVGSYRLVSRSAPAGWAKSGSPGTGSSSVLRQSSSFATMSRRARRAISSCGGSSAKRT